MLVGCNIGKLEEIVKALKVLSFVVSGNVTPESDVESIFERAVAEFDKLDVLIKLRDNEPGGDNGRS